MGGVVDNLWKVGRNDSCTTEENKKTCQCKSEPQHPQEHLYHVQYILQQAYPASPDHTFIRVASWRREGRRDCQSLERKPSMDVCMSTACKEVSCRASQTAWSQSIALRPAGFARLWKVSSSNLKFNSDRHHSITWASVSLIGGGGGVAGSMMFICRSSIANPSKWWACCWAFALQNLTI